MERPLFVLDKDGHATPAVITANDLNRMKAFDFQKTRDANNAAALDNFNSRPARQQNADAATMLLSPRGAPSNAAASKIAADNRARGINFGLDSFISNAPTPNLEGINELQQSYGDLPNKIGGWFGRIFERMHNTDLSKYRVNK
jgi:hypothetical protein